MVNVPQPPFVTRNRRIPRQEWIFPGISYAQGQSFVKLQNGTSKFFADNETLAMEEVAAPIRLGSFAPFRRIEQSLHPKVREWAIRLLRYRSQ
ncbi:hypothetical protein [Fibrobacter intestinalis]|uniref:hypothetical protein n=1 Tax=Fibrobacter TaxID=832 RepID=UPI00099A8D19|nr:MULTISPECIES: hypothetical protein [Fibrobacter]